MVVVLSEFPSYILALLIVSVLALRHNHSSSKLAVDSDLAGPQIPKLAIRQQSHHSLVVQLLRRPHSNQLQQVLVALDSRLSSPNRINSKINHRLVCLVANSRAVLQEVHSVALDNNNSNNSSSSRSRLIHSVLLQTLHLVPPLGLVLLVPSTKIHKTRRIPHKQQSLRALQNSTTSQTLTGRS